jgi:hypothetical protein
MNFFNHFLININFESVHIPYKFNVFLMIKNSNHNQKIIKKISMFSFIITYNFSYHIM